MTDPRRNLTSPPGGAPADRPEPVHLAPDASPVGQPAVWWRLADLDPWGENPRDYSKAAVASLAALIRRHGFNEILGAHWPTRRLVRGHRRRLALTLIWTETPDWTIPGAPGPGYVPVRFRGGPWEGTDGAEADALADNRAQEDGAWDLDAVGRIVTRWTEEGEDLAEIATATAFGDQELREIVSQLEPDKPKPADVPPPSCPTPPAEPSSKIGQVYQLGPHRLVCGDTTNLDDLARLMDGRWADAVITDPPFAVYGSSTGLASSVADDKMIRPFFRDVLTGALAVVRPFAQVYVCCDWRSWAAWWGAAQRVKLHPSNLLVWDKGDAGLGSQWANGYELIGFFTAKPERTKMFRATETGTRPVLRPNVLRGYDAAECDDGPARQEVLDPAELDAWLAELEAKGTEGLDDRRALLTYGRVTGADRVHNAAKPIPLLSELIDAATDSGGLVVDLFGGSGSTLLAAARTGRVAYLVEIDPLWCDVIRHRWTAWAMEAGEDPGPGALVLEDAPTLLGAADGKPAAKRTRRKGKAKGGK